MSQPNLLNQLKHACVEFWSVRDARERKMLTIAAGVIALGLVYALLIAPAITGRDSLSKKLPALREQTVLMQALAKEVAIYAERTPPTITTLSKTGLEAALAHNGLMTKNLAVTGEFVQVQLTGASFASTLNWLNEMQKTSLASVTEANITALAQPDSVDAKITLQQHRNQ